MDRCHLTPERWAQIEELFHRAVECETKQRVSLLDEACTDDPELRREVEVLLSCDGRAGNYVQVAVRSELDAVGFPLSGKTVSHYRILDGVGGGGMGLVYRAEDIRLGRQVALKFLPEDSAKDALALGRFEREARAASALEHPNICSIYEFGEHEGQPFLVMQLLEGQTVGELIHAAHGQPPLGLNQLVDLAIQITDGLEAAHRQNIIHRDIKPANIFITNEGRVKILDFGLAKLARAVTAAGDDSERDHGNDRNTGGLPPAVMPTADSDLFLSRTGVAMGTAGYMSPEQVRGEKLDARTDLFSFGLVLYEMATAKRAFKGDTGAVLHDAILKQVPTPARQLNSNVPAKLGQIITKALEKDREVRYRTVSEMRADLEILKREMGPRNRFRWLFTVAVTVIALIAISTFFWFEKRQPSTAVPPNIKFRQLTINSSENPVSTGAISPNGKYLAYVDTQGIHVKDIETGATQTVAQLKDLKKDSVNWEIIDADWLPDSTRFLANAHPANESSDAWSSRTTNIWMFSRLNTAPRRLREHAIAWSVSPDGALISFGTNTGKLGEREIWLMDSDGEQARKLFDTDANSSIGGFLWSADGQRGLSLKSDPSGDTLLSRDVHGGPPITVLTPSEGKQIRGGFSWLPDGRLIYQVGEPGSGFTDTCNFWTMRLDQHTGKLMEGPKRLTNGTGSCITSANATADGRRLAFLQSSGGHDTGYVADLEAGGKHIRNPRHFTLEDAYDDITDWTADSKTLILVYTRGDHYGLYRQPLSGDTPEPIVASGKGGLLEEAFVSPDGKWVITQLYPIPGGPSEPNKIMRVPLSGGAPELIFNVHEGSTFFCARPPSNLCAVAEQSEDRKQVIITAFDPIKGRGSELARFDQDPAFDPKAGPLLWNISPDGTRIVAARSPQGPILIHSLRGQPIQVIKPKALARMRLLSWAADGRGLFVSNLTKTGTEVVHVDLRGKTQVMWKSVGGPAFGIPSPDGRHLAIDTSLQSANMWMMENF